ncbi:siderophore-interacting protein [Gulosibacter chungangensis]|uniref:Siderophore-interacting protein n=1 Tax=Gulosibacter chungangensis TaxID=979746 RepID=A0A7J5B9X0_9MICO|nr:siderophore-interacting protein [Gulosibacter chungangensis]KAB1642570.1 siderophore-interacting protein [Gulosibacter chungangensis]
MTEELNLTPTAVRRLLAVLNHPDHQRDLEERHIVIESVINRANALVRVTGKLSGSDPLEAWRVPNVAVRLFYPEQPLEFEGVANAPANASRAYTIAEIDVTTRTVAIDIVRHNAESPAMRWLETVQPGDSIPILGPRPHRVPAPGAPRILLADSSALPAALSILRRTPFATETTVFIAAPTDEVELFRAEAEPFATEPLHIRAIPSDDPLPLSTAFRRERVPLHTSVWASGEREDMRSLRRHCRSVLFLPAERVQVFGYWKQGVSNTRLDIARLQATENALATGKEFSDSDDFEISI